MKRLFLRIFQPRTLRILDYVASYPSRWANGGTLVEVLRKKFDKGYLDQLVDAGYLVIEDEPIGFDDLEQKVYSLRPKSNGVARTSNVSNSEKVKHEGLWTAVTKGILTTVIGALILAVMYIVVREYTGVELPS